MISVVYHILVNLLLEVLRYLQKQELQQKFDMTLLINLEKPGVSSKVSISETLSAFRLLFLSSPIMVEGHFVAQTHSNGDS